MYLDLTHIIKYKYHSSLFYSLCLLVQHHKSLILSSFSWSKDKLIINWKKYIVLQNIWYNTFSETLWSYWDFASESTVIQQIDLPCNILKSFSIKSLHFNEGSNFQIISIIFGIIASFLSLICFEIKFAGQ